MKTLITSLIILIVALQVNAQQVERNIEFKTGRAAGNASEGKLKKAKKKIYVNQFRCFYQLVYVDQEQTRAGVNYGTTKASLKVGLKGINADTLTQITNELYHNYINQLKADGFEIITSEEAAKIKQFQEYERIQGGTISNAQLHGYAMATPSDLEYFVKKVNSKGKQKSGMLDKRGKISTQLDEAAVVNVDLYIGFMAEAESKGSKMLSKAIGGVSKVVAAPNFRIIESKSKVSYFQMSKSTPIVVNTPLKKDVKINGVFEHKKYKASSSATQNTSTNYGAMKVVFSEHVDATNLQMIDVNTDEYYQGLRNACSYYMNESTSHFLKYAKGEK